MKGDWARYPVIIILQEIWRNHEFVQKLVCKWDRRRVNQPTFSDRVETYFSKADKKILVRPTTMFKVCTLKIVTRGVLLIEGFNSWICIFPKHLHLQKHHQYGWLQAVGRQFWWLVECTDWRQSKPWPKAWNKSMEEGQENSNHHMVPFRNNLNWQKISWANVLAWWRLWLALLSLVNLLQLTITEFLSI